MKDNKKQAGVFNKEQNAQKQEKGAFNKQGQQASQKSADYNKQKEAGKVEHGAKKEFHKPQQNAQYKNNDVEDNKNEKKDWSNNNKR